MFGGVVAFVGAHDVLDVALHADLAVVHPDRGVAQLGEELVGVGGEDEDAGALDQLCSRMRAFSRNSASTAPMPSSSSRISGSMLVTTPSARRTRMPVE